jgi:hypothetical protein
VVSVTPRPRFNPGERTPGTHCTGGWVGPRAGLDTQARGKILYCCQGSNLDRPVTQSVVRHYTAWATRLLQPIITLKILKSCISHVPHHHATLYSLFRATVQSSLVTNKCTLRWNQFSLPLLPLSPPTNIITRYVLHNSASAHSWIRISLSIIAHHPQFIIQGDSESIAIMKEVSGEISWSRKFKWRFYFKFVDVSEWRSS